MADKLPPCVCPHARYVDTDPTHPKIVCGVMEEDQRRADPIMEGAPVGIVISAREDPSTFLAFCTGTGQPAVSPDTDRPPQHYTECPVFAAETEWREVERLFGPMKEKPDTDADGLLAPEELTPEEAAWLSGKA